MNIREKYKRIKLLNPPTIGRDKYKPKPGKEPKFKLPSEFAYAVAYTINANANKSERIFDRGILNNAAQEINRLSGQSLDDLWFVLTHRHTYGGSLLICWDPLHAFSFHSIDNELLLVVDVCFYCNHLDSYDLKGKHSLDIHYWGGGFSPEGAGVLLSFFEPVA